jgi:CBS domain-containing protein
MKLIQEFMSKDVHSITPQTRLSEVSRLMTHQNLTMLPVQDQGRMTGVVTEHDIVAQVLAQGRDPLEVKAQEVMSPKNFYCYINEDVEEALERMEDKHVSRLFVIDDHDHLVGELLGDDLDEMQESLDLVQIQNDGEVVDLEDLKLSDVILRSIESEEKKSQTRKWQLMIFSVLCLILASIPYKRRKGSLHWR